MHVVRPDAASRQQSSATASALGRRDRVERRRPIGHTAAANITAALGSAGWTPDPEQPAAPRTVA